MRYASRYVHAARLFERLLELVPKTLRLVGFGANVMIIGFNDVIEIAALGIALPRAL